MNYFGLVISTFASTFSRYSPQPETCITSSSSCWAQKPALKQGCSLQGFTLSHQAGPSISPCGNRASSTGSLASPSNRGGGHLPACPHPSRAACSPEPTGSWWGATTGSSADQSGQGRRRMERDREGGSPKGQVQRSPRCRCRTGWAAGERWYLADFPTPRQAFQARARRQVMLGSCWGIA